MDHEATDGRAGTGTGGVGRGSTWASRTALHMAQLRLAVHEPQRRPRRSRSVLRCGGAFRDDERVRALGVGRLHRDVDDAMCRTLRGERVVRERTST